MNQEKVGRFLAQLRKEAGMTQEQMAQKLGVTNKTVSRWETGKYMPDVSLLLEISQLFNVSVNELLSGERLGEKAYISKADDNITYLLDSRQKAVKKVIFIAVVAVVLVLLLCAALFAARFVYERSRNLYSDISDSQFDKNVLNEVAFTNSSSFDGAEAVAGEDVKVRFVLPEGYGERDGELYTNANGGWFTVRTYNSSEYPFPNTPTLTLYFADNDIVTFCEKVKFAYCFDLSSVNIFDGETDIEIASGCRMIRSYNGLANADDSQKGVFCFVRGEETFGYFTTSAPIGASGNVWSICLEKDGKLCFVVF